MRRLGLLFALALALALTGTAPAESRPVSFEKDIQPILSAKCQPCHFPGGTMYAKRPFDKPATIITLGERLFTRIKDEKQRAIIRAFLAESKR